VALRKVLIAVDRGLGTIIEIEEILMVRKLERKGGEVTEVC
jgi:hypothetical protein